MVYIIQENLKQRQPSTGERFAQAFGNAGRTASEVIPEYMMQQQNQQLQDQRQQAQNTSLGKLSGMDFNSIQDPKLRQIMLQSALKEQELSKGREHDFSMQAEKLRGQKTEGQDLKLKQQQQSKSIAQNSFNGMVSILEKGNIGKFSNVQGFFGGETSKDIGKFTSFSAGLEGLMKDMVTNGALTDREFRYITEDLLPKPSDTQQAIRGKLEAIGETLGLDMSQLSGVVNEEDTEPSKGNKTLDDKTMQEIYKKSGGDKEKSKRMARKMGYKL